MPHFVLLDLSVLNEGYLAGRRGLTDADNPYPVGTRDAIAWVRGFMKGPKSAPQGCGRRQMMMSLC